VEFSLHSRKSASRINPLLKSIPFFVCLSDEEFWELRKIIREKHFQKNQVILLEDQTSHYMYVVYSGKVKAVQISQCGREKILAIHEKGDYFGEMALLDGKTSPATVIAMEDTVVGLIGKEDFEYRLLKNDRVKREIISLLCARIREAWLMLKVLSFSDAEHRVRAILGQISSHYGVKIQGGTLIRMNLTHQDIADCAAVSRETATRILHRFSESGEIENLGRRSILLKPVFFKKMQFL
jgi:CRP/FNR family cyclic AMP-dependent transcriptional regulator